MKSTSMVSFGSCLRGSLFAGVFVVLAIVMSPRVEGARVFEVGDNEGWHVPPVNNTSMYNDWAAMKRFHVGDFVNFEYNNDSVLMVDKHSYFHCKTNDPVLEFNNGNSTINLDRPGPFYFISGTADHCKNGQRLIIEVMGMHPPHVHPPSIAHPPGASFPEGSLAPSPSSNSGVLVSVTMLPLGAALAVAYLVLGLGLCA